MKNGKSEIAGVIGGVCMAHAPQFFTLPETEDKDVVDRVEALAQENGKKLKALNPDVYIVIANDHADQFLLDCVASFTIHHGKTGKGSFAGRDYQFDINSELATALVRYVQDEGYDPAFTSSARLDYSFGIPLTFLQIDGPIVPIFVNAYVPPQPRIERCYQFGRALERGLKALGVRAVVITSGGLSHFPGTDRYDRPELEFDRKLMAELMTGNLRWLLSLDEERLDQTGNIELRCWAVAAGMLGERVPDMGSLDPSWHHNYATLAWYSEQPNKPYVPHYPSVHPDLVTLTEILHKLANDPAERQKFADEPIGYARDQELDEKQRALLAELNQAELVKMGIHPFLPFMVRLQLDRDGIQLGQDRK